MIVDSPIVTVFQFAMSHSYHVGPPKIAKLVHMPTSSLWFMVVVLDITMARGA